MADNYGRHLHDLFVGLRERIQWILDTRGIGQRELSRRAGLKNQQHVSTLMARLAKNPRAGCDRMTLVAIAKGGEVSVDWLTAEDGSAPAGAPAATPADMRERVWLAYHSLPREKDGEPPSFDALRRGHIAGNQIYKLFAEVRSGARLVLTDSDAALLAIALQTSPRWLKDGSGAPPTPTGPVPPLPPMKHPQTEIVAMATGPDGKLDPARLARRNTWQYALNAGYAERLTPSAVERVKAEYLDPADPGARTLDEWKQIFHRAMTDPKNVRKPGSRKKRGDEGHGHKSRKLASGDS